MANYVIGMTLTDYLSKSALSATEFAGLIGCEPSTITRLCRGERGPSLELALKIEAATNGSVTPKDFISPEAA